MVFIKTVLKISGNLRITSFSDGFKKPLLIVLAMDGVLKKA